MTEAWETVKDRTSQAQITCQGFGPGSPFHFGFALRFTFFTLVLQLYTEKQMKMCRHYSVFLPFNVPIRLKFSRKENRLNTGKEGKEGRRDLGENIS